MSSDDRGFDPEDDGRRPAVRRRWPISRINAALVIVCVVGAIVAVVAGHPRLGAPLLAGALLGGLGARLARRVGAGDLERVNALEYADERERAAGIKGLAAVGVAALVLTFGQMIVVAVAPGAVLTGMWPFGMFLVLAVVWFLANWFFVRRG